MPSLPDLVHKMQIIILFLFHFVYILYFCSENTFDYICTNMRQERNIVIQKIKEVASPRLPKGSKVMLYGSRARGDAHEDSDWDILVVVNKPDIDQNDYRTIIYPITALGWDIEEMIIPVIYTKKEWEENSFTPFYKNVEQEGIAII